ncbi:hypothetical protein CCACVL1_09479 [Corchorus capsularis]|uniref:Retrovirus-related Pol polyprotein from transposon TNT 1-94 n=1 Tax=Corchorus capsularis TaxID=210143 RepID=A0A1R3IVZ2_COCAP|nr:hypothetical protein CCACVL1_09479 [Corchorus capsularis]
MKDLGAAKKILGMEIWRDRKTSLFALPSSDDEVKCMSRIPYSSAVGSLMYVMVCTRLDLAHDVSVNVCLVYGSDGNSGLIGYVDSDYAGGLIKRRSLTCYISTLYGCATSWKATLKAIVALSTTEAEYMSLTEGIKEGMWLYGLVDSLGLNVSKPVTNFDSQSALSLAKNPVYHERSKHIDVRLNLIRDALDDKVTTIEKIHTADNPADMLTKPLTTDKFKHSLDLEVLGKQTVEEAEIHGKILKYSKDMGTCEKNQTNNLKKLVVMKLRNDGYEASLCKTSWVCTSTHQKVFQFPGGYEYIDVMVEENGRSAKRVIVDMEFRSQFEVARPTLSYKEMINNLPLIFVGTEEKLKRIIPLLCSAAKSSNRMASMFLPGEGLLICTPNGSPKTAKRFQFHHKTLT